jgi:hypothetical protein
MPGTLDPGTLASRFTPREWLIPLLAGFWLAEARVAWLAPLDDPR